MAANSQLKIISQRCVKPSSPTPPSCKCYKLSSLDQDMADVVVSVAFFYPKQNLHIPTAKLCQLLETSLSRVLTYYYPFAGRLKDNTYVDCNDMGVQMWAVQIQSSMSEILDQPDHDAKDVLFPKGPFSNNSVEGHLLMIQINHFECGSIGIGVCISHKLGDAQTICNFINDWAAIARGSTEVPSPQLAGASVFPPSAQPSSNPSIVSQGKKCATRRFAFSASSISRLKAMAAADSAIQNPSKVEVVTALIFKSAMAAAAGANSDSFRTSLLFQAANFRPMTIPPLSKNYVGNFFNSFLISAMEEKDIKLSASVGELRKSKLQFQNRHRKSVEGEDLKTQIHSDWEDLGKICGSGNVDVYFFSSWCRFPFYKVDFGWGEPIYVCIGSVSLKNTIILIDTQSGDGIEALVSLEEAQMSIFEHDEEFLAFASLNPNTGGANA